MSKLVVETIEFSAEQGSDPSAPAANKAVMFMKDNGSGRTQVAMRFANGSTVILGTQNKSDMRCSQTFRGLSLRSHTDSDSVTTKIIMPHADEIVMNDGESVTPADNLVFNKATTGSVGGMQTASAVSTWNKLYYIRKSADGVGGLWGLRAKDYLIDAQFTTTPDISRNVRIATSTATDKVAQGFQLTTAGKVEFVDVQLNRAGSINGNYWFTIESDAAGSPSGTVLATSDKYDASRLTTAQVVVRVPFRTPATLSSGTQYHLIIQGDWTRSDSVYVAWAGVVAGGYTNGVSKEYNGTTWSSTAGVNGLDRYFKIYVTENDTSISLPSGFDQYAHIGWFYVDSGGLIRRFTQTDRQVRTSLGSSWKIGAFTTGFKGLQDASTFFPPVATSAVFRFGFTNLGEQLIVGSLAAQDLATSSDIPDSIGAVSSTGSDSSPNSGTVGPILVDYAGFNLFLSTSTTPGLWTSGFTW